MTPDERNLLQRFLSDLEQSRGAAKDPEADAMIAGALRANPDAAYLLVQHALLADQALQAAQGRIEALEQQQAPARMPASFLGAGGGQSQPPTAQQYRQDYWDNQPAPRPQSAVSGDAPEPWPRAGRAASSWPRACPTCSPRATGRPVDPADIPRWTAAQEPLNRNA